MVPVASDDGHVRHVPLSEWRAVVLPEEIKRRWTEPDALARLVECAIEAGMHADVLAVAEHLGRIDPDRERRYALPAIVLARNGQFSRAEELLDRHAELYGLTWYGLYARAEVALSGNRRAKGQELLRQALELDPDACRPLRRLIEDAGRDGERAVEVAVRGVAVLPGGWRAKLWLAASPRIRPEDAMKLVRLAVEQSRDDPDVLTAASSVLTVRGLTGSVVDFVAPRYRIDRDRLECGINLLFALLSAGRKVAGEALLQKLTPVIEDAGMSEYAGLYRTAFLNLRESEGEQAPAQAPSVELLKAMAAAVRLDSEKARRRLWQLLADARLLVPMYRAWIEVPLFESPWPAAPQRLEVVTGIDSEGRDVVIAFTDERTLGAWGPMRSPCVAIGMRDLLTIAASEKGCSLLVNPAGPTATELALPDIEAFLDGRKPAAPESRIRFLAEPLRREIPSGFVESAGAFLRESGIVTEAWLFEMVDDRSGVNPAVAIGLAPDAQPRDVRELMIDAADEIRWDARRSRRVRFVPLANGALAEWVRAEGVSIPLPDNPG